MSAAKSVKRYKEAEGKRWIEVRVRNALQLFDARDPAPFRDRDLDEEFVDYVISSLREFSRATRAKIVIYIDEAGAQELELKDAIRSHLAYEIQQQTRELKLTLKRGQVFLALGLCVLALLLGAAQSLDVGNPPGLVGILKEGLVIFGWVSVWKPVEVLLFDWYPIVEKRALYRKALETEIAVHSKAS